MTRRKIVFADVTFEMLRNDDTVVATTKSLGEAIQLAGADEVVNVRSTAHHNNNKVEVVDRSEFIGRFV